MLDAGQRTIRIVWQRVLQELSQRCGIQQAARWLLAVMAAADQAHTPPSHVADERERADVVHLVWRQAEPQAHQLLGCLWQGGSLRREKRRVHGAGRNTGQDRQAQRRKARGDRPEHAGLVRAPRAAAAQHQGQRFVRRPGGDWRVFGVSHRARKMDRARRQTREVASGSTAPGRGPDGEDAAILVGGEFSRNGHPAVVGLNATHRSRMDHLIQVGAGNETYPVQIYGRLARCRLTTGELEVFAPRIGQRVAPGEPKAWHAAHQVPETDRLDGVKHGLIQKEPGSRTSTALERRFFGRLHSPYRSNTHRIQHVRVDFEHGDVGDFRPELDDVRDLLSWHEPDRACLNRMGTKRETFQQILTARIRHGLTRSVQQ